MNPPPSGKPTGPVPMLDDAEARQKVLSVLSLGGSLNDAADYVGIDRVNLFRYRQSHPDFEVLIKQAEVACKLQHIQNVHKCGLGDGKEGADWKASLAFLERKYPAEWARRDKLELQGSPGAPLVIEHEGRVNLSILSDDDLDRLDEIACRVEAGSGTGEGGAG